MKQLLISGLLIEACGLVKRLSAVIAVIFISTSIVCAGEHYKCKVGGEFGSIVWQDTPCRAGEGVSSRTLREYSKQDSSKKGHGALSAKEANQLIRYRKIRVGMSKKDVIKSWGVPNRISVTLSSSGKNETLRYNSANVVMNNKGIASSIHYTKHKPKPVEPSTGLGTVRTSGYGQYTKQ